MQVARDFLLPRSGLFASVDDLQKLNKELDTQRKTAVGKALSLGLEDDEEEQKAPTFAELKEKFLGGKSATLEAAKDRYPDGYFQSKDGKTLVVLVRTGITTGELQLSREALAKVKEVAEKTLPDAQGKGVQLGYAGDLVTGLYEYGAVLDDLVHVGTIGVAAILGVIFIYYRRFRVLVPMAVTMFAGLTFTFGLTRLVIGHLNVITGFLVSIIAGNGINFGILYVARFLEERRRRVGPGNGDQAIAPRHLGGHAHRRARRRRRVRQPGGDPVPRLQALRLHRHVGDAALLDCDLLPRAGGAHPPGPALAHPRLRDRARPELVPALAPEDLRLRAAVRVPRLAGAAHGGDRLPGPRRGRRGGFALWLRADPIDYDMRHMQNDLGGGKELYRVAARAADVLGNNTESGMVVLANTPDEVPELKKALEDKRDAAPPELKPFEGVHALQDFVPADQEAKIPLLEELRRKILKARRQGGVSDADWKEMKELLPPENLKPYTLADPPEDLARPFSEVDGTRGRLAFITPTNGKDDNDLHYLLHYADSFRLTKLPNGRRHPRVWLGGDLRRHPGRGARRHPQGGGGLALAHHPHGLPRLRKRAGRAGGRRLAGGGAPLADAPALRRAHQDQLLQLRRAAHHLRHRRGLRRERHAAGAERRRRDPRDAVHRRRGGAQQPHHTLGYLALLGSVNQAVRSLGLIAVLGEVCCLAAAMLALPSWLMWRERVKEDRTSHVPSGAPREATGG